MGCDTSVAAIPTPVPVSTKKIFLTDRTDSSNPPLPTPTNNTATATSTDTPLQQPRTSIVKKQQSRIKVCSNISQYLQGSKQLIERSIETSLCVNQALQTLSYNSLLNQDSYRKLITINKKCLQQKQNRIRNLEQREQKAGIALEKAIARQKAKSRSEREKMRNSR